MGKISNNNSFPDMARITQITSSHCGPATLAMLLNHHNISMGQGEIAAFAGVEEKLEEFGMNIFEMADAVKKIAPELTFWYKDHSSREELDYLINKIKMPVGVEWQGVFYEYSDGDDGHYSVVVGINIEGDRIVIADPYEPFSQKDRIFKLHKFIKRWWDVNEIVNPATGKVTHETDDQMMFILTKKGETFPIDLGMKTTGVL